MAWWEGMVTSELQKLEPGEIERVLTAALSKISHDQFIAASKALKAEALRRGLLKVNTSV